MNISTLLKFSTLFLFFVGQALLAQNPTNRLELQINVSEYSIPLEISIQSNQTNPGHYYLNGSSKFESLKPQLEKLMLEEVNKSGAKSSVKYELRNPKANIINGELTLEGNLIARTKVNVVFSSIDLKAESLAQCNLALKVVNKKLQAKLTHFRLNDLHEMLRSMGFEELLKVEIEKGIQNLNNDPEFNQLPLAMREKGFAYHQVGFVTDETGKSLIKLSLSGSTPLSELTGLTNLQPPNLK